MNFSIKNKFVSLLVFILVLGIILSTVTLCFGYYLSTRDTVKGVEFNGKDLSGASYRKADKIITDYSMKLLSQPAVFTYQDKFWMLKPIDVGVKTDATRIIKEVINESKNRSILFNLKEYFGFELKKKSYILTVDIDRNKLESQLEKQGIKQKFKVTPIDAKIYVKNRKIIITNEIIGKELDVNALEKQLLNVLNNYNVKDKKVFLAIKDILPNDTASELKELGINRLLASYTTRYNQWQNGRSENIRIAAESIDNYLLRPGESFSFNKVVGPRTIQRGFRYAPEIVNGKLKPGIGGGVCQVSSTLYNAILLAELDPVRRINHTKPSHYVPLGLDATVSYGSLDFVFKNNLPNAVLISTATVNGRLTVEVYGKKQLDNRVVSVYTTDVVKKPYSVVIQKDTGLMKGTRTIKQKGSEGYTVKAWRAVKVNGKIVKREKLSRDFYKPVNMVIVENI